MQIITEKKKTSLFFMGTTVVRYYVSANFLDLSDGLYLFVPFSLGKTKLFFTQTGYYISILPFR